MSAHTSPLEPMAEGSEVSSREQPGDVASIGHVAARGDAGDEAAATPSFGVTSVNLDEQKRLLRMASTVRIFYSAQRPSLASQGAAGSKTTPARSQSALQTLRKFARQHLDTTLHMLLLFDALYLLLSVPLRIGFLFDPSPLDHTLPSDLVVLSALDIMGEVVRTLFLSYQLRAWLRRPARRRRRRSKRASLTRQLVSHFLPRRVGVGSTLSVATEPSSLDNVEVSEEEAIIFAVASDKQRLPFLLLALGLVPVELVALVPHQWQWLHLTRIWKCCVAYVVLRRIFTGIVLQRFRSPALVRQLAFSTSVLAWDLFWLGLYLCHVCGCLYMLVAHLECGIGFERCEKEPVPGCWVLKDNLEAAGFWRQYIRTMYWASKTVTTLGQGDLTPATELETDLCIIVQFVSGVWATAFLSACSFYFSRHDANLDASISTRLNQAVRFVIARDVPIELAKRIEAYHQYMVRTRKGIEEDRAVAALPVHYRTQCSNYVKFKLIKQIPFFQKQSGPFLRTVLSYIENDFVSPNVVVVRKGMIEELLLVSRGELRQVDDHGEVLRVLMEGSLHAVHAIFDETQAKNAIVASKFSELFCLSRQSMQVAMEKHFPRLRIAMMVAQFKHGGLAGAILSKFQSSSPDKPPKEPTSVGRERVTLLKKMERRFTALSGLHSEWREPDSRFCRRWRLLKLLCLIVVAIDVPYDVAFEWRFSLVSTRPLPTGPVVHFLLCTAIELVFYFDWYLRVFEFGRVSGARRRRTSARSRAVLPTGQTANRDAALVSQQRSAQVYLESTSISGCVIDVLSNVPFYFVWKLLPKHNDAVTKDRLMGLRFLRLLTYGRLTSLRATLESIMIQHDVRPAAQLMTGVVLLCVVSANAMGCLFFLLADSAVFDQGLPVIDSYAATSVVTFASCLNDASLYENCTWYMYDSASFGVNAAYLRSLHWALVLLSTVGYGDILSFSTSECLLGFWWIYLGALICYFTASALSSAVAQATILRTLEAGRLEEVNRVLTAANAPGVLKDRVRAFYLTNWKQNGSTVTEEELLAALPRSLRQQLMLSLYAEDVARCPVLQPCRHSTTMIREIAQALQSMVFLEGMRIVEAGQLATEMFFIMWGKVEVTMNDQVRTVSTVHGSVGQSASGPRASVAALIDSAIAGITRRESREKQGTTSPRDSDLNSNQTPVTILSKFQSFGEDSLMREERVVSRVSVRALLNTLVAVLPRDRFCHVAERFPAQCEQINKLIMMKRAADTLLYKNQQTNLRDRPKTTQLLGVTSTFLVPHALRIRATGVIAPGTKRYLIWHLLTGVAILYNFYQIPFRVAFLPYPSDRTMQVLTIIDYALDAVFFLDIYLKWTRIGFVLNGAKVIEQRAIQRRYARGCFRWDCLSMLPTYIYGDYWHMTLARLPRLVKSVQLLEYFEEVEMAIQERWLNGSTMMRSAFDLVRLGLYFLSAAHQVGSLYYLLARLQIEHKYADTSWITVDPILNANPDSILVQYIRSLYWCLETFTVVCFGDVLAHNALETVFASMTCILGWVCISQVIGKMTSLMTNMDQDAHELTERIEDFEQYAKRSKLPLFLRERAIESIEYRSKCELELRLLPVFQDLPTTLSMDLLYHAHAPLMRQLPEFIGVLSTPQFRAVCSAIYLQIYLPDDLIIEEGRLGTKLFVMKEGRAEVFAARSNMVFSAIHEGVLFGDIAFFLKGTKQVASVRASRSCQVLQLDRARWLQLWPDSVRAAIEARVLPAIKAKYESISRAYVNIVRNFELARSGARPTTKPNDVVELRPGTTSTKLMAVRSATMAAILARRPPTSKTVQNKVEPRALINAIRFAKALDGANKVKSGGGGLNAATAESATTADQQRAESAKQVFQMKASLVSKITTAFSDYRSTATTRVVPWRAGSVTAETTAPTALPKPSRRKLSGLTGVIDGEHTELMARRLEEEWKRHKKNMRVMKFVDTHNRQKDIALQTAAQTMGIREGTEVPVPGSSSAARQTAVLKKPINAGDLSLPSAVHEASVVHHNPRGSVRPTVARSHGSPRGVRHSIQVNRMELKKTFQTVIDEHIDEEESSPSTNVARKVLQKSGTATANERATHGSVVASTAAASAVPTGPQHTLFRKPTRQQHRSSETSSRESRASTSTTESPNKSLPGRSESLYTHVKHLAMLEDRSRRRHRQSMFKTKKRLEDLRNPYDIWFEPPLPPSFCMEHSHFRKLWSIFMLAICLYYVLVVPFRASFGQHELNNSANSHVMATWLVFEYVFDFACVIDFVLHKNFFTFIHRGEIVTDSRAIRKHYLKHGTYVADLLVILPTELLLPLMFSGGKSELALLQRIAQSFTWYRVSVCRLTKIIRIVHLHALSDVVQRFVVYDLKTSVLSPATLQVLRFTFDFALGAHWVACLFYGVAFAVFRPQVPSWLSVQGMLSFQGCDNASDIVALPLALRYARAYHFSMGAITTVSYGDIAPQNATETLVATFVIVISIVLFGMLSGGWFKVFDMQFGRKADYEERVHCVAHYVAFHRFQSRMWSQMRAYYAMHWEESLGMNEGTLLRGLTASVRNDITLYVKRDFVTQLRLFATCEEGFARAVVAMFEQELYVRNDIIIAEGDTGRSLFVIESGLVSVRFAKRNAMASDRAKPIAAADNDVLEGEVIKGRFDFIGEKSLLFDVPRSATCIALSTCSMLILTVERYHKILEEFPHYREKNMREWIFTAKAKK